MKRFDRRVPVLVLLGLCGGLGSVLAVARDVAEYTLAVVPAGRSPAPEGDTILEKVVPPGLHSVEAEVILTSAGIPAGEDGPEGWAIVVSNDDCMSVKAITLKGVVVSTVLYVDLDDDLATKDDILKRDPYFQDLGDPVLFLNLTGKATKPLGGEIIGAATAVIMRSEERQYLHANAADVVLRLVYEISVKEGEATDCGASFADKARVTNYSSSPRSRALQVTSCRRPASKTSEAGECGSA